MRIDELIHAFGLAHCLPLTQHMEVVGIGITDSKYRKGIVSHTWQSDQRPVVREPYDVLLERNPILCFDADLDGCRVKRSPAVTPSVTGRVTGVEGELINHRALRIGYRMRPAHMCIEAQAHAGGTDQADAVSIVDAGNGEVFSQKRAMPYHG